MRRSRSSWLVSSLLVVWALLFGSVLVVTLTRWPTIGLLVPMLLGGVILGIGRQGIDVLLLRLFAAATALFVGPIPVHLMPGSGPICVGALDCAQSLVLGVFGLGLYGMVLSTPVSILTTVIWNMGVTALKPEIHWPVPTKWWHWALLLSGVGALIFLSGLILGVPWPA
jgi:hypothetical protein